MNFYEDQDPRAGVPAFRSHVSPQLADGQALACACVTVKSLSSRVVALFFGRSQQACGQYNTRRNNISSSRRTRFRGGDSARGERNGSRLFRGFLANVNPSNTARAHTSFRLSEPVVLPSDRSKGIKTRPANELTAVLK